MKTYKGIMHIVASIVGSVVLMALAVTFSTSVQASTTQASATPVQLAYWHGPGYRHGYYCHRVCWRDRWGYRHCDRRC